MKDRHFFPAAHIRALVAARIAAGAAHLQYRLHVVIERELRELRRLVDVPLFLLFVHDGGILDAFDLRINRALRFLL